MTATRKKAAKKTEESFVALFRYEKSTKNTHRYAEDHAESEPAKIPTLYILKHALGGDTPPERISVEVRIGAS
jgi:hypothetical protein